MDGSTLIDQQCTLIKEQSKHVDNHQLKNSLDTIVLEMNKDKLLTDAATIQHILTAVSLHSTNDRTFFKANLLDHQLFFIIRDYYLDTLNRWRIGQKLDPCSGQVFSQIATLFANLCWHATDTDVNPLKQLLIHEPLINELRACLKDIATHGKHLQDRQVEAIDYSLRAIHYLENGRVEIQSMPMLSALLDSIVSCVCSSYFVDMFKQIGELEKLNEAQTFLLDTCTNYISCHDAGRYNDTCIAVRTALLSTFTSWFQKYLLSFHKLSQVAIKIIGQLCITLIGGNASDGEIFPQPFRDGYCKLIDQLSFILNAIVESETIDTLTIELTRVLTQNLYSLTMTNDLRTYIKSKHIVPLLLKLTNTEDETIQFHVYRILASIMTEEDIKILANPSKIANVFLRFFTSLIDNSSMIPRFYNLLRSLKILIQHDEIKEELTIQNALPLLLRCTTESKFDPIKVRLPVLEILLALTFNAEAARQLKQNSQFISNLKILVTSSTEQRLQRVAEGLLWKLEKEETAMAKADASSRTTDLVTKTYNIMLSYSHSDKDLCYHIHDRLVKDNLRVWIDRDEMHGQMMVAMADAIENSEFVFICMSDAYKQSVYCQSEAHYAFERRCHLIPLVMKSNYRPDGWLGILVSGKIHVDFPKLGFEVGYAKLRNEIARYRIKRTQSTTPNKPLQYSLSLVTEIVQTNATFNSDEQKPPTRDYPHCINQWTTDHVRSFLVNEKLDSLLPVLGKMNGRLLHETYKRCKAHWDLMFQTFKTEVAADGQQKLLTIDTYIRFLDEIEKYIPIMPSNDPQSSSRASAICILL